MNHGIVDVFAYQEALLIEAAFAIALLVMLWVGFRRWLRYKENAQRSSEISDVRMDRIEARLNAIEQNVIAPDRQPNDRLSHPMRDESPDRDQA